MEKGDRLRLCTWQYSIRHATTSRFRVGEFVFIKSNPEFPMKVIGFEAGLVMVATKKNQIHLMVTETILQYKFAAFVETQNTKIGTIPICLN